MNFSTEIWQTSNFKEDELKELRSVEVKYFNGFFQVLSFRIGDRSYEFRHCMPALKELQAVLSKVIEIDSSNKVEIEQTLQKGKSRLIRTGDKNG